MKLDRVRELTEKFSELKVGVIGDLMLDRYVYGAATRISPEAPVPVVRQQCETVALGGAANVLRNLVALGGGATAFGVVGGDPHADELRRQCREQGIDAAGIVASPGQQTTVKTRIIADGQQVARIDDEDDRPVAEPVRATLLEHVEAACRRGELGGLIIEDYNKGVVAGDLAAQVQSVAAEHRVLTALDPHPGSPQEVKGLSLMTPNRHEALAMAGIYYQPTVLPLAEDRALAAAGRQLFASYSPALLLVTLGAEGMALFEAGDAPPTHIPTVAREVFDVSGAGDTVIAAFVLAMLAGASNEEAATLANHAAGIVVAKTGTVPAGRDELLASFAS